MRARASIAAVIAVAALAATASSAHAAPANIIGGVARGRTRICSTPPSYTTTRARSRP